MSFKKIIHSPIRILKDVVLFFVTYLPGPSGNRLRAFYYRKKLKKCGRNVVIGEGTFIDYPELVSIGDNVHIDRYCILTTGAMTQGIITYAENCAYSGRPGEIIIGNDVHVVQFSLIAGHGGVQIGDRCTIGTGTRIYSFSNLTRDRSAPDRIVSIMPYSKAPALSSPVVLQENVWVAINCILMPGTSIDKNSFVRSQSLVMGSHSENSYIAGNPAKRIKNRYSDNSGKDQDLQELIPEQP